MKIEIRETGNKGSAIALEYDRKVGEMTYSKADEHLMIIDHTEVDPAFGGKGLGQELLMTLVNMAREKKIKIIPLCPFANAQFKKQKDIQDVLK
ncbi:MAG: N-acetyltransferase [Chitinophagales bacterium]|nr:N-acetyltransferase [Chitinophagales bacterium]